MALTLEIPTEKICRYFIVLIMAAGVGEVSGEVRVEVSVKFLFL